MPREPTHVPGDRNLISLLHELIEESLVVWGVQASVTRDEPGLSVHAGTHIVSIRCDPRNAVATWWVAEREVGSIVNSRERPRTSSLGVLRDLRLRLVQPTVES